MVWRGPQGEAAAAEGLPAEGVAVSDSASSVPHENGEVRGPLWSALPEESFKFTHSARIAAWLALSLDFAVDGTTNTDATLVHKGYIAIQDFSRSSSASQSALHSGAREKLWLHVCT